MYISTFLVSRTESLAGWLYFACWSLSYYPQIYLNYSRKSVKGLSLDYVAINLLGFTAYSIYTVLLYTDPQVSEAFSSPPEIDLSDLSFAIHGLICTLIIVSQCIIYPRRPEQKLRCPVASMCLTLVTLVFLGPPAAYLDAIDWKSYVNFCGGIKFFASFSKNLPQVMLNSTRQSTEGFSFDAIFLHFIGAMFSLIQQGMQAYLQNSLMPFISNLTKTGLAVEGVCFDVMFATQHAIWYRPSDADEKQCGVQHDRDTVVINLGGDEHQALIGGGYVSLDERDSLAVTSFASIYSYI